MKHVNKHVYSMFFNICSVIVATIVAARKIVLIRDDFCLKIEKSPLMHAVMQNVQIFDFIR